MNAIRDDSEHRFREEAEQFPNPHTRLVPKKTFFRVARDPPGAPFRPSQPDLNAVIIFTV